MGKRIVVLGIVGLFLWSCNKSKEEFDNQEIIRNIVEKIIKPEETKFYNDAVYLQNLTKEFVDKTTVENLGKVKKQWVVVAKDWARCYSFDIGFVKKGEFFRWFATFPVNAESLEQRIKSIPLEQITPSRVESFGANTKGLYGIEYLLYGEESSILTEKFLKSEKRRKVLQLIVNEFVRDVDNCKNAWDKYAPELIENKKGEESIDNSLNQIIGGINNVIHFAWETKIGKAIRKNDIEAPYSKLSLDLIRENVAMTKKVYFSGIDKKVKFTVKSDLLNNAIKERYKRIEKAFDTIQSPLQEAIKTEREKVDTLLNELKLLQQNEFKTGLGRALSFIEPLTDGDGD
ncbi:MAG: hypothetical protein KGV44_08600 [Flavobacteriaceae bacterium]|nr:hypothetical protein [Flavobacteriaceae bacterium]